MNYNLLNFIMKDGSRQFAELPESVEWNSLRDHLKTLEGVTVTNFITDQITEVWIDFVFKGYNFTVNNQFGEYWFFVNDPACPDKVLLELIAYCEPFLVHEYA